MKRTMYEDSVARSYRCEKKKFELIKKICKEYRINVSDIINKTFDNVILKYLTEKNEKM